MSAAASLIADPLNIHVALMVSQPQEAEPQPILCEEAPFQGQQSALTFLSCSPAVNGVCCKDPQCPPFGVMSIMGKRREMEDAVATCPALVSLPCYAVIGCTNDCSHEVAARCSLHFFGVYDGHVGPQAALYCKNRLHKALLEELSSVGYFEDWSSRNINWEEQWQKIMLSCFRKVDMEVSGGTCGGDICDKCLGNGSCAEPMAPETVGSTAIVAVVSSSLIIVANCGDSRAVLSRGGRAVPLSVDHKPDRVDELARVEAAGGKVICWNGYRILGVLAMSRAIGDRYLKPYVIADPEVKCVQRTEEDEFLILATDGLWDVISNEAACDFARKYMARPPSQRRSRSGDDSPASATATFLTRLAMSRNSKDNISVVVIDLRRGQKKQAA